MPNVSIPKAPQQNPSPQSMESFTATLFNSTGGDLVLVDSGFYMQWTTPPPSTIANGTSATFGNPGDFSKAANGYVVYKAVALNNATFQLSWSIPSVGPNHITWTTDPGLAAQESGSLSGWNVSATWELLPG